MIKEPRSLRYWALRGMNLVNILRAYDASGIPSSDAQDAFSLLREMAEVVLSEKERSFGFNCFKAYKELEEQDGSPVPSPKQEETP